MPLCCVSHFIYCDAECHRAEFRYDQFVYAVCRFTKCCYAECRYAECRFGEFCHDVCRYAEGHYAECRYAECRYTDCRGNLGARQKNKN